jgi:hypothetical protein
MAPISDTITIYRPDVFDCFRDGVRLESGELIDAEQWFATAIAEQYQDIANRHGCRIELSTARLEEARSLWSHDTGRIDIKTETPPDHFKRAGFLVYWLRRRAVLNFVHRRESGVDVSEQDRFLFGSNEVAAFLIGFRLCLFFEMKHFIDIGDHIGHDVEKYHFDSELKFDIATLLRHKNVSPHSLYLIFRSLFYDLKRPPRSAPILTYSRS